MPDPLETPTLADVLEEVREVRSCLYARSAPIPPGRLYTKAEAGFRITHDTDPARVPEGEAKEQMREAALSARWVSDRLADDDSGLRRTTVGRSCRVAERDIEAYLKRERRRSGQRQRRRAA